LAIRRWKNKIRDGYKEKKRENYKQVNKPEKVRYVMYEETLWNIVLFDKLIVSHLVVKKLPAHGIRNSDTDLEPDETSPHHLILFL
jgi:hypothetical protein